MKSNQLILFLYLVYLNINESEEKNLTTQKLFKRQSHACTASLDFSCALGGCISRYEVCDGENNCADGSDETTSACGEVGLYYATCSEKYFKCQYGACVNVQRRCDGRPDCSDKSDEYGCPGQTNTQPFELASACKLVSDGVKYSQCDDGSCIDQYNMCDGTVDCADRSDETATVCNRLFHGKCEVGRFRCAYGACLQQSKYCDGRQDCWDGSDEVCSFQPRPPFTPLVRPTAVTPPTRVPPSAPSGRSCTIPSYAENRRFGKLNCQGRDCELRPGRSVAHQQFVVAFCDSGHQLGQNTSQVILNCRQGQWFPEIPYCQKLCPQLSSDTLDLVCKQGVEEGCNKPMIPGTRVQFRCKQFFQSNFGHRLNEIRCQPSGQWSGPLSSCTSKCGQANLGGSIQPAIVGGSLSKAGTFPWHAALFHYKNNKWELACGGTLINTHMVLTAAHCVTAKTGLEPPPLRTDEIMAVLGKYYREYNRNEGTEMRVRVKEVVKHRNYRGEPQRYAQDIAILVLEYDVPINSYVMPACVDYDLIYEQQIFQDQGNLGYIPGWGNTEDCSSGNICSSPSPVLKYTRIKVITNEECYRVTQPFRPSVISILTNDKFCAGDGNVSLVQPGDSGGGITFSFNNAHYVYGIVSVKLQLEISDKKLYSFSAFTSIPDHMKWLKDQLI